MPRQTKKLTIESDSLSMSKTTAVNPSIPINAKLTVPDASTDLEFKVFVAFATLVSFNLTSNVAVTVETNSGTVPDETFNLNGTDPETWMTGEGAKPIAQDVTSLFITNSSGSEATVKLIAGWD